jgi:hypothetical protein
MELRPLDLGGIFERAIALYVRNFATLIGIVVVTIVPAAIVQYVAAVREQPELNAMLDLLANPERLRTEHVPVLSPATLAVTVGAVVFGYVMLAFAIGAVAAGVARIYRNEAPGFRTSFQAVLVRWYSLAGVVGIALLVVAVAYAVTLLIVAIPILTSAAFAANWLPLVAPLAVSAVLVAMGLIVLLLTVTSVYALCAVVVEGCGAVASLQSACARVLERSQLGRALLCSLVLSGIGFVASLAVDALSVVGLAHWAVAYVGLDALFRTAVVPFVALVFAIYYFDVRIRREGFDLQAGLGHIGAGENSEEPTYAPTAYLSGEERAMIKRFIERRESLTAHHRHAIAAKLAGPVRARVPAELQRLDDEALLERL